MAKNWAQINAIRNNVNAQAELKAPIIQSPIIQNMFLPNHSGDHSAGTTKTPEKDIAIANKAYVDNFGVAHLAAYDHTLLANINQDVKTTASPSFVKIAVGNGTAAAPSLTFAGDPDTGIYSTAANYLGISAVGAAISYFTATTNYADSFFYSPRFITPMTTNYPMTLTGRINDGASAVGVILDNSTTLATGGAKLVSIRNATIEKAYIDKDGIMATPYLQTTTSPVSVSSGTVAIVAKDANLLTNNAGWLPMKKDDGTTIYVPYWL